MEVESADGVSSLKLLLFHGNAKHNITVKLPKTEEGDRLIVRHLSEVVENITDVPQTFQKLIFKGKALTNPNDILLELGIKEGSKIMLVGRKPIKEDTPEDKILKSVESELGKNDRKVSEITYQLDGLHRGFIPEANVPELLGRLSKQLTGCTEMCTKLLVKLDGLTLPADDNERRAERKKLVDKLQTVLDRCDGLTRGVKEISTKCGLQHSG